MLRPWAFTFLQRSRTSARDFPASADGRADAAASGGPGAVLDRDVVVNDHALDLQSIGPRHVGGKLEVHHVAGVILDDMERAFAAIDSLGRGEHLVGRRAGEDRAWAGGIEHAQADESAMHRFMSAATTGDHGHLVFHRRVGAVNEGGRELDLDEVTVGRGHALQGLIDDVFRGINEFFHTLLLVTRLTTSSCS
jgi:hypothetical protein